MTYREDAAQLFGPGYPVRDAILLRSRYRPDFHPLVILDHQEPMVIPDPVPFFFNYNLVVPEVVIQDEPDADLADIIPDVHLEPFDQAIVDVMVGEQPNENLLLNF